ncbi:MAG: hypothetical protein JO144_11065 [Actinobacteria bacterium]|nr:hypothetical protein [Actinomycetota bacterium]
MSDLPVEPAISVHAEAAAGRGSLVPNPAFRVTSLSWTDVRRLIGGIAGGEAMPRHPTR